MKNLIFILSIILLTGCSTSNNHIQKEIENPINNARMTINWSGTYQGILPCSAPCNELATMIILYPDNSFTLRTRKIGIDIKDNIKKGHFQWLENNNYIKLDDENLSEYFTKLKINHNSISAQYNLNNESRELKLNKTGPVPIPPPTI